MGKKTSLEERFIKSVIKTDTCWIWTGSKNANGYGVMQFGNCRPGKSGFKRLAHRMMYEHEFGPFNQSLFVCHHCDNPPCVNPAHLFLGTQKDNMRDCSRKGRLGGTFDWSNKVHPLKGKTRPKYVGDAVRKAKQKPFVIVDPNGEIIKGVNFTQFCKERGLNKATMGGVMWGRQKSHKGYTRYTPK